MLNYTELVHDGYHNVKGGMYKIVEGLVAELKESVNMHFGVEITRVEEKHGQVTAFIDSTGKKWEADLFVVNADAAAFRGQILKRKRYRPSKLDQKSGPWLH